MKHIDFYLDIIQKKTASGTGGGGGITPVGTKTITSNGKHDVTAFATADVQVPIPEAPTGKKVISVTENGVSTHDVASFAQAEVNVAVPMPAEPTGEKVIDIVANGTHTEDIKKFATAKINVNVPSTGITPQGTKTITENGTHDVAQFAQAKVEVPMPAEPTGTKEITSNGTHDVKAFANVNVAVPVGVTPQGTKEIEITANGEKTEDVSSFKNVHIVTNVPSAGGGTGVPQEKYNSLLDALSVHSAPYTFENEDVVSLKTNAFYEDYQILNVILPNLKKIEAYTFYMARSLKKVKCVSATSIGLNAFQQCRALETIDILGGGTIESLSRSGGLPKTIVIRSSEKVTTVAGLSDWGGSLTSIYVADELVEQYKTATNWSSKADKIKPLSEYVEV